MPHTTTTSDRSQHTAGDHSRPGVIALITEGTYPTQHGGVGTWCHELVGGLPDFRFDIYAVTASGHERPVWELPANVGSMVSIPLWGTRSAARRRSKNPPHGFAPVYGRFLQALFHDDHFTFLAALKDLHAYAVTADLGHALASETALRQLHDHWTSAPNNPRDEQSAPTTTVADVFEAAQMLEHFLRPLSARLAPADVYHSSSNGLASLVAMAGKWRFGVPFILTEHGVYLRERYLSIDKNAFSYPVRVVLLRFFRLVAAAAYHEADLMTPVSGFNRRWAERNGADPAKVRTVHNAIDPRAFPESDVHPNVPTLAFVGRIDPLKDLETLIKATAIVRQAIPDVQLRLFGNVPKGNEDYAAECQALIDKLGLTDAAKFEGPVPRERIVDAYRSGDLVVLSSISEGFPYTVIEAMMSERATISTDVGGVAEAVGGTGLVVSPRDPVAFATACVQLLDDGDRRRALGRAARERALEFFTLDRFLDIYREVYVEFGAAPARVPAADEHRLPSPDAPSPSQLQSVLAT
jgi:glycosyltransferase involved in cell wall biosynthesis